MVSGLPPMVVSVNVSPRQFRGGEIVETIASALHDTGLPPRLLQIELTENMAMQGAEQHVSMLTQIKALGVQLAIDDFGTGYSNLSYLKRFPVDQLKVDRSFVAGLPDDEDDTAIVRAIITLGHQLGLRVVAEGVETESQQEFLRENNCDELQGYLLGRPVPADEFTRFMDSRELSGATQQLRILSSMPIAG
jgi:EAL domain-containing protein (putative c-di-GMP-specific phosphodiesterase class I)